VRRTSSLAVMTDPRFFLRLAAPGRAHAGRLVMGADSKLNLTEKQADRIDRSNLSQRGGFNVVAV